MREFDLLQHVYQASAAVGGSDRILIGPGDDMALVALQGRHLLAAVDQLIDGRHVKLESTPIDLVGRKAIARSVSDVAAMAGRPTASLVAVALPVGFGEARAKALFDAMRAAAESFGVPLIGGDIAMHVHPTAPLVCSVTVLAEPATARGAVMRCGATPGDSIYVTGSLGGSLQPDGLGRHLTFTPRVAEGIALAELLGERLHAMIDISDGLGRDASHLAQRSNVRIEINSEALPCHAGCDWMRAMRDGEDYELCFAASGDVPRTVAGTPITAIGRVVAPGDGSHGTGTRVIVCHGSQRLAGDMMGWEHAAP